MDRNSSNPPKLRDRLFSRLPLDADFDAFCIDHFPDVSRRFTSGQDRIQKTNILLLVHSAEEISAALDRQGTSIYFRRTSVRSYVCSISGVMLILYFCRSVPFVSRQNEMDMRRGPRSEHQWSIIVNSIPNDVQIINESSGVWLGRAPLTVVISSAQEMVLCFFKPYYHPLRINPQTTWRGTAEQLVRLVACSDENPCNKEELCNADTPIYIRR